MGIMGIMGIMGFMYAAPRSCRVVTVRIVATLERLDPDSMEHFPLSLQGIHELVEHEINCG